MPVSVFDTYPRASFNGVEFPVESSRITGGLRDHVHEYPHSPGGSPEKLGRQLYEFQVSVHFDARFTNYPGLYPQGLDTLQGFFEQQTTADFRLPQMPSAVPSYCRKWTREMNNRMRSGEKVELTFIEDQSNLFLFADLITSTATNVNSSFAAFAAVQPTLPFIPSLSLSSLFQQIGQFVGSIQGYVQLAQIYGTELSDSVQGLINTCASIDTSQQMQNISAAAAMEAMHELWSAAQQMQNDIQSQGVQLESWVVPVQMDIGRVSMALYAGDSSRSTDLLALNDVPDSLLIRAGTSIRYYPIAA